MARMNVNNLAANLVSPARNYLWEVIIPNPIQGDSEDFLLRARSASMPGRTIGTINVPFKQTAGLVYPGKNQYSQSWELEFIEGEDRLIFQNIYNSLQDIINDREGVQQVDDFRVDMYLDLINTDGETSGRIKLIDAYFTSMGQVNLSQADEGEIVIPATVAYNFWERVS